MGPPFKLFAMELSAMDRVYYAVGSPFPSQRRVNWDGRAIPVAPGFWMVERIATRSHCRSISRRNASNRSSPAISPSPAKNTLLLRLKTLILRVSKYIYTALKKITNFVSMYQQQLFFRNCFVSFFLLSIGILYHHSIS